MRANKVESRVRNSHCMEKTPTRLAADPTPAPAAPKVSPALDTEVTSRLVPMFRVMIHNDPVTPMDFVVAVLRVIFRKEAQEAVAIMMEAHNSNVALVAILPLEEAEHRIDRAHSLARTNKFPLTFTIEPE